MKRAALIIVGVITIISLYSFFSRSTEQEKILLSSNDHNITECYIIARNKAKRWHKKSFLTDMLIEIKPSGKKLLVTYFNGSSLLSRFSDRAKIVIDLADKQIVSFDVAKGSNEPNYDNDHSLEVNLRHSLEKVLNHTNNLVGLKPDSTIYVVFSDKKWLVRYISKVDYINVNLDDLTFNHTIEQGSILRSKSHP